MEPSPRSPGVLRFTKKEFAFTNSFDFLILMIVRVDGYDGSVGIVVKLGILNVPSVVYTV